MSPAPSLTFARFFPYRSLFVDRDLRLDPSRFCASFSSFSVFLFFGSAKLFTTHPLCPVAEGRFFFVLSGRFLYKRSDAQFLFLFDPPVPELLSGIADLGSDNVPPDLFFERFRMFLFP